MVTKKAVVHEEHCTAFPYKRISWTAVFVGALVGVGLTFLLSLFSIAIGLSAFTLKSGTEVIAMGGLIGICIAIFVSMLVAGYAAGYLGRWHSPHRNLGILYGFTTWSVAILLGALVWGHVGQYTTTFSHAVGTTIIIENMNKNTKASDSEDRDRKPAKVEASTNHIAYGAFVIFGLFFLGAFSSCLGGCWGMTCKRKD